MNSRSWSHNPTPKPLGHGHIWRLRERSNLRIRLFRPALDHLSYAGKSGGDGENRTLIGWVQTSSPPVERRPHGCGGGNRTRLVTAYETVVRASSSSPHQQKSLERVTGFEPVSGPWQGPILAARRYPHNSSCLNYTYLLLLLGHKILCPLNLTARACYL